MKTNYRPQKRWRSHDKNVLQVFELRCRTHTQTSFVTHLSIKPFISVIFFCNFTCCQHRRGIVIFAIVLKKTPSCMDIRNHNIDCNIRRLQQLIHFVHPKQNMVMLNAQFQGEILSNSDVAPIIVASSLFFQRLFLQVDESISNALKGENNGLTALTYDSQFVSNNAFQEIDTFFNGIFQQNVKAENRCKWLTNIHLK